MIFVGPRFAAEAILEAADAGIGLVACITEGIAARDMAEVHAYLTGRTTTLVGPNCPGVISPGSANVGIIPGEVCAPGRVGFVSRSGTLVYQIVYELTSNGIGQSTCIGMGGDPVHGIGFIESLALFEGDPGTDLMIMTGEIGGDDEERAASYIHEHVAKPVVAYIAGFEAPVGKRMGHAGAIVTGSAGTAAAKAEALEAVGVQVARTPSEVARLVADRLAG
jgi:succinyl-CoA synthetase alpha subunit